MTTVTNNFLYSQRKNNLYSAGDTIDFYIPETMAIINPKETHLIFNLRMKGSQFKACPNGLIGANALFRNVTISNGDQTKVIETLNNYAWVYASKAWCEQNESGDKLKMMHEGKPSKMYMDKTANQYVKGGAKTSDDCFQYVQVTLPLYLSGHLYNRDSVCPNLLTNGCRIKIELNNIEQIMEAMTAPLYTNDPNYNAVNNAHLPGVLSSQSGGGYSATTGYGVYQRVDDTNVTLLNVNDSLNQVDGENVTRCLTENMPSPPHLFLVGQKIYVGDAEHTITAISYVSDEDDENRVQLTVAEELDLSLIHI